MKKLMDRQLDNNIDNRKLHYCIFFVILIALTILTEYINTPLVYGHDTKAHYTRLFGLMQAMQNGQFPWYLDYNELNNYGYFMKAFYCDVLLIPFAIIGLITDSFFAFKLMIISITIFTGISTFWATKRISQSLPIATIASLLYTFCNYRLIDCYIRGSIGELFAMMVIPIVFLGVYEIIHGNYKKWYILAFGCSALIFAHLLSTYLTFILLAIVILIYCKRFVKEPARLKYLIVATITTVCITAYYIFPMFEQMLSTRFVFNEYTDDGVDLLVVNGLSIKQLLTALTAGVTETKINNFKPNIGILLTSCIALRLFVHEKTVQRKYADIMVIAGIILFCLSWKYIPWHIYPFKMMAIVLFPWRLYMFVSFFFAFAGAYYASTLLKTNKQYFIFIISLGIVCYLPIKGESATAKTIEYYEIIHPNMVINTMNESIRYQYGAYEYLPVRINEEMRTDLIENERKTVTQDSTTLISNYHLQKGIITFDINQPDKIEIPQTYYLGYAAYVNGKPIELSQSDRGLLNLDIKESGRIEAYYKATNIQIMSTVVSCISILAMCFYIFRIRRRERKAGIVE